MTVEIRRQSHRISPQIQEIIDRRQIYHFTFNGNTYNAHPGDTIASALAAAGVKVFSRSFKYHRPRGLLCCAGHCPNCLVQIGEEMDIRSCITPVQEGMEIEPQNVWPSLKRDAMSLTALGDRFLPVGFYYKTFIRPPKMWPIYEEFLRNVAGLGKVNPQAPLVRGFDKQYVHADVVIVGGGPSGMSAALAAANAGARVALFDDQPALGGHVRFSEPEMSPRLAEMAAQIHNNDDISVFSDATVLGWWEENWLGALRGKRLYKIRGAATIFATGLIEQPTLFDNNDLPGVMLGSGVLRLLRLYGVAAGQTAVIVTANDDGWHTAAALQAAGISVAAVVDQRHKEKIPVIAATELMADGTHLYFGHTVVAARGRKQVEQAVIAPLDRQGTINLGRKQAIPCDLLVLSVAWAPDTGLLFQAGSKPQFDEMQGEYLPGDLPPGIFAAGRVTGLHDTTAEILQGKQTGAIAAAAAGYGTSADLSQPQTLKRTSTLLQMPGKKKQFICFCEDVTAADLETAVAEGYNSIELLKRYSTISMGPCQGKMCSVNAMHLCARANGWSVAQTGTTTSRPPTTPIKLGVLGGQLMEPVKFSPVHDWHIENGAKMMVAGLWMRPEHYGNPSAEVRAVRERVGLIDVSTLGKMKLTGPGVPDLLDKIYINKWQKLAIGRVRYGVMCNDEGIVMDDGVTAHVAAQEWYTTTTSSGSGAIYEWIQWWLQSGWGTGVHLTNVTAGRAAFNLAGPRARDLLQLLCETDLSAEVLPYMGVLDTRLEGVPCRLMRIGFTGELSYEIHCPAGYGRFLWDRLIAAGVEFGISPFGVEAQRVLRLEKGHIIIGQDTDALSDPLGADLGWALKLDKPDFLGKRALSRISAEGTAQKLVGFKMLDKDVVPEEGLQIVQPDASTPIGLGIIGWVTSCRYSPTLDETIGLCWLPAEMAAKTGASFTIRRAGQLEQAVVHHGPFYDPDGSRLKM